MCSSLFLQFLSVFIFFFGPLLSERRLAFLTCIVSDDPVLTYRGADPITKTAS